MAPARPDLAYSLALRAHRVENARHEVAAPRRLRSDRRLRQRPFPLRILLHLDPRLPHLPGRAWTRHRADRHLVLRALVVDRRFCRSGLRPRVAGTSRHEHALGSDWALGDT